MDIGEIRHRNFTALIEGLERSGIKRRGDQGARLGGFLSASYVSQLLGGKHMGDDVARKISEAMGHDRGWMDRPQWDGAITVDAVAPPATPSPYVRIQQIDAEAGMGGEVVNDDYPDVVRAMDFTQEYIRGIVGFVPPPGRLILMTGRGDSMVPTIQPGDTVVVDTGVTSFDGDGLYLINMGSGHQIKRLVDRGSVHVASDNRAYGEPFQIPEGTVIGGKVYLRNRIERFN